MSPIQIKVSDELKVNPNILQTLDMHAYFIRYLFFESARRVDDKYHVFANSCTSKMTGFKTSNETYKKLQFHHFLYLTL